MPPVLVSFASFGRENYHESLLRLIASALPYWNAVNGDYLIFSPDHPISKFRGVELRRCLPDQGRLPYLPHRDMPYQFKYALIDYARSLGYEKVVWLDSAMKICRDLMPLFRHETGITVFHNLGHPLYKYMGDEALNLLGIDEERLRLIPQIWGGAQFWDFSKPNAREVWEQVIEFAGNGSFSNQGSMREGFVAHRHDQAVLSALVHGRCRMLPYGNIVNPPHDTDFRFGKDFYLISRG